MKGFKQCDNGHFYKDTLSECNYCPKRATSNSVTKTEALGNGENKTSDLSTEKTQIFGGTVKIDNASASSNSSFDPNKTTISGGNSTDVEEQTTQRRKLRGWLVSFDIEPFGVDFKVNEGRNTIGNKASNDITIQDNQVSSFHSLILYKKNKFLLTDELSTNGTLLNGEELTPRDAYDLNDGDEIKVGDTNLLFKTAFKK